MLQQVLSIGAKALSKTQFQMIPTPSSYKKDILSFLEDLGYPKQDFLFSLS